MSIDHFDTLFIVICPICFLYITTLSYRPGALKWYFCPVANLNCRRWLYALHMRAFLPLLFGQNPTPVSSENHAKLHFTI
jgi:hypothetical protein